MKIKDMIRVGLMVLLTACATVACDNDEKLIPNPYLVPEPEPEPEPQDGKPHWVHELIKHNKGFIVDVKDYDLHTGEYADDYNDYERQHYYQMTGKHKAFLVYYRVPVSYDGTCADSITMRAEIVVPLRANNGAGIDDPSTLVSQVYISGEGLSHIGSVQMDTEMDNGELGSLTEMARYYDGNWISLEHRYYGTSVPDDGKPWESIANCRADYAAKDFHRFFTALSKVFTGRRLITGVNKGGTTAAIQQAYYPGDANFYVAYGAPFCYGTDDASASAYLTNPNSMGADNTEKETFTAMHQLMYCFTGSQGDILQGSIYKNVSQLEYMYYVADLHRNVRQSYSAAELKKILDDNAVQLAKYGVVTYTADMLGYMLAEGTISLAGYTLGSGASMPENHFVKAFSQEEWGKASLPAIYQFGTQLGHYDYKDFSYYFEDSERAAEVNAAAAQSTGFFTYAVPVMKDYKWSSDLYTLVMDKTQNALRPMLFIYGENDPWTGAAIEDQYVGGNVKKVVLPGQSLDVNVSAAATGDQNSIFGFIDGKLWE